MEMANSFDSSGDYSIDPEKYVEHFMANRERYSETGFNLHQIRNRLEDNPELDELSDDLDTMVEEGLLERREYREMSKMPDQIYILRAESVYTLLDPDEEIKVNGSGEEFGILRNDNHVTVWSSEGKVAQNTYLSTDVARNVVQSIDDSQDIPGL